MRRVILVGLMLSSVLAAGPGCNRRVFQEVLPTCDGTIADSADIASEKAADILIVVDNSGSMQEEQDRLAAAFINTNEAECPLRVSELKDFALCDSETPPAICRFSSPSQDLLRAPGPNGLAQCGFIQVLAAFENDFRVGVITTDVGECDNRFPTAQGGDDWGFHPQRGCLQPNGPLGTPYKVISRQDLLDQDPANDDIGQRFSDTLANIRTYGSPIERGLDAVDLFLDPATERDERCAGDLDSFLRPNAQLLVIFLTDEEDCSRNGSVEACPASGCGGECDDPNGCEIFVCASDQSCESGFTEFVADNCGINTEHFTLPAANCYDDIDKLTPVSYYVDRIVSRKASADEVKVAVIAGGLADATGEIRPAGCTFDEATGQPNGVCDASKGNSTTASICPPGSNCCLADAGGRYFAFADSFPALQRAKDTICVDSFNQTMIGIAVLIADVDSLKLVEPPADESLVVVEKAAAGTDVFVVVPRTEGTSCDGAGDGWVFEVDQQTIRFCGSQRPLPGERIRVSAKGKGANGSGPDACEGRGTTAP